MMSRKAVTVKEYVDLHYAGNQADFARRQGVSRSQANRWISEGFIVVNGALYSRRRFLK